MRRLKGRRPPALTHDRKAAIYAFKQMRRLEGKILRVLREQATFDVPILTDTRCMGRAQYGEYTVLLTFSRRRGWETGVRQMDSEEGFEFWNHPTLNKVVSVPAKRTGDDFQSDSFRPVFERFMGLLQDTNMLRSDVSARRATHVARVNGPAVDLQNVAKTALMALEGLWGKGGDMGYDQGLLVKLDGEVYALKLELWTDACLADLRRPTAMAAKRRGEALSVRWKREYWPATGYFDNLSPEVYGCSWAADVAKAEELALAGEDDILQLDDLPSDDGARSNPSRTRAREATHAMKKLTRIMGVLPTVLRRGVGSEADMLLGGVSYGQAYDQRFVVQIVFDPEAGWTAVARVYKDTLLYHKKSDDMLQNVSFEQAIDRFAQLLVETRMVRPELDVHDVRRRLLGTGAGASPRSNPSASEFHELARQARVGLDHLTTASSHVTALRVKMQLVVGALERLAQSDDGQPLTPEQAKLAGRAMDFLHHIVLTDPAADAPHIQAARDVAADVVNRVGAAWLARDYARAPSRSNPPSGRVTVDNYEGPVVLDLGGQSVRFDNKHGYHAESDVADIRYRGMVVMMRPSMFLALAERTDYEPGRSLEYLSRMMRTPGWGYPIINVSFEGGVWTVRGHEGRHRCRTLVEMQCDEEIPVAVFCRGRRARTIYATHIEHLREGAVSQDNAFVRGPLFGTAFCDGVEYPPPHAGLYPIG